MASKETSGFVRKSSRRRTGKSARELLGLAKTIKVETEATDSKPNVEHLSDPIITVQSQGKESSDHSWNQESVSFSKTNDKSFPIAVVNEVEKPLDQLPSQDMLQMEVVSVVNNFECANEEVVEEKSPNSTSMMEEQVVQIVQEETVTNQDSFTSPSNKTFKAFINDNNSIVLEECQDISQENCSSLDIDKMLEGKAIYVQLDKGKPEMGQYIIVSEDGNPVECISEDCNNDSSKTFESAMIMALKKSHNDNNVKELVMVQEEDGGWKTKNKVRSPKNSDQHGTRAVSPNYLENKRHSYKKHVYATAELEQLMQNLKPVDFIENHVTYPLKGDGKKGKNIRCNYCNVEFFQKHEIIGHIRSHKGVIYKPWKCPICSYQCSVKAQMARHINIHGQIKPYICKECGKGFNFKQKLQIHFKYHLDIRDIVCPICPAAFHEHKTLKNHMRYKHPDTEGEVSVKKSDFIHTSAEEMLLKEKHQIGSKHSAEEGDRSVAEVSKGLLMGINNVVKEEATGSARANMENEQIISYFEANHRRGSYGTRKTNAQTEKYKKGLIQADVNNRPTHKVPILCTDFNTMEPPIQKREPKTKKRTYNKQKYQPVLNLSPHIIGTQSENGVLMICKYCSESGSMVSFNTRQESLKHLAFHDDCNPWSCPLCSFESNSRKTVAAHICVHQEVRIHQCPHCDQTFMFPVQLKKHLVTHETLRKFVCSICMRGFGCREDVLSHQNRVHDAKLKFSCEECSKQFRTSIALQRHIDGHGGVKRFPCPTCGNMYLNRQSLAQHVKCHSCIFHCEICNKDFGSYSGFMAHKVMHSESYDGFQCEICLKKLHTKGSLNRHTKVFHTNVRPFQCAHCAKAFKSKKDLKNHGIVHQEGIVYNCANCSFHCKRVETMKIHMKRHTDVECSVCSDNFASSGALQDHMKESHPDVKDESVGFEQPSLKNERRGLLTCEECDAIFLSQDELAVHILSQHMSSASDQSVEIVGEINNVLQTEITVEESGADGKVVQLTCPAGIVGAPQPDTIEDGSIIHHSSTVGELSIKTELDDPNGSNDELIPSQSSGAVLRIAGLEDVTVEGQELQQVTIQAQVLEESVIEAAEPGLNVQEMEGVTIHAQNLDENTFHNQSLEGTTIVVGDNEYVIESGMIAQESIASVGENAKAI